MISGGGVMKMPTDECVAFVKEHGLELWEAGGTYLVVYENAWDATKNADEVVDFTAWEDGVEGVFEVHATCRSVLDNFDGLVRIL